MNTRITLLTAAIAATCGSYTHTAMSRPLLPDNAILTIDTGGEFIDPTYGTVTDVTSGAYFGMDLNGTDSIQGSEKTALSQGTFGLRIGVVTTAGASHLGAVLPGDTNELDAPWEFSSSTGSGQFITAPNEIAEGVIDMTGYRINWNENVINMGDGLVWQPTALNCSVLGCTGITFVQGQAVLIWDGTYGNSYVLHYTTTVPAGDPSGFGGTQYYLHYEGTVLPPPNDPPVVGDFSVPVLANATRVVDLGAQATDADGNLDLTSAAITNDGSCGGAIINNNDGTVTLPACPASTYIFNYTFSDTAVPTPAVSNLGTVSVTVTADPIPDAQPDSASTDGVTPVLIDVLANDTDIGGTIDPLTVAITSNPSHGVTSVNATSGVITYTANAGFSGIDTFTYTVDDNTAQTSAAATVSVTVNALNIPSSDATFTAGDTAIAAGSTSGIVTSADIGVTDTLDSVDQGILQSCIGGCFDFELTGFVGTEAMAVLPLSTPLPTVAAGNTLAYRKLISTGWQNFDITGDNAIHTAPGTVSGTDIICPPSTDIIYDASTGLTAGHQCVRLTITDDGPNDNAPATVGTIADPGGIVEIGNVDNRVSSTSGCSVTGKNSTAKDHAEWLLVAGFIALLGFFRLKRKA